MNIVDDYYPDISACDNPRLCVGGNASACYSDHCPRKDGPPWFEPANILNSPSTTYVFKTIQVGVGMAHVNNMPDWIGYMWLGAFDPSSGDIVGVTKIKAEGDVRIVTKGMSSGESPYFKFWLSPHPNKGRDFSPREMNLLPLKDKFNTTGKIPAFTGKGEIIIKVQSLIESRDVIGNDKYGNYFDKRHKNY